jgi:hypothetical protein
MLLIGAIRRLLIAISIISFIFGAVMLYNTAWLISIISLGSSIIGFIISLFLMKYEFSALNKSLTNILYLEQNPMKEIELFDIDNPTLYYVDKLTSPCYECCETLPKEGYSLKELPYGVHRECLNQMIKRTQINMKIDLNHPRKYILLYPDLIFLEFGKKDGHCQICRKYLNEPVYYYLDKNYHMECLNDEFKKTPPIFK